ncbi:multiple coagulation factor deficiency protein 2-like [Galendromus occidentalis]|uniref:Multiple coagulation factor deficiency protein 2-like n=1 Tax=Galendromus occidentalis TaxID=34638 RepID=A0AAJ6QLV6_9ACAR|nr:multiple coagulation factor deficiency protein 2-like [Galendromus occidentalis]
MTCFMSFTVYLTVLLSLTAQPSSSQQPPTQNSASQRANPEVANEIRKKYAGGGFVRDMDHIKEDLRHLIQFADDGVFTPQESIFYLLRMHDFDDNNHLDGLELMRAFGHAHGQDGAHEAAGEVPVETLEELVDTTMKYDSNGDGLLSYAEWVKGHASQ